MKLHWIFKQYMAPEDGDGANNGGSPADGGESDSSSTVDWGDINNGVSPGSDDADEGDPEPSESAEEEPDDPKKKSPEIDPTTGKAAEPKVAETAPDAPDTPEPSVIEEPLTAEQLAAQQTETATAFAKWETEQLVALQERYKLDDETALQLQTEPELVYPKLAAQLHMDITKRVVETMQRLVPQMVPQVVDTANMEKKAMETFYGANKDLVKYHKEVLKAGKMFRELNPKATPEQAVKQVGEMVRTAMGLPPLAGEPAGAAKPGPHRPAQPGGGSGVKPPKPPAGKNEWAELLDDD